MQERKRFQNYLILILLWPKPFFLFGGIPEDRILQKSEWLFDSILLPGRLCLIPADNPLFQDKPKRDYFLLLNYEDRVCRRQWLCYNFVWHIYNQFRLYTRFR